MRILDRALSALLLLGAVGHTLGVMGFYRGQTHALFWLRQRRCLSCCSPR